MRPYIQPEKVVTHVTKLISPLHIHMRTHSFVPMDPMSVIRFLPAVKIAWHINDVHKGTAMLLLQGFSNWTAVVALLERLPLKQNQPGKRQGKAY